MTGPSCLVLLPGQVAWAIPPLLSFLLPGQVAWAIPPLLSFLLPGQVAWAVPPLFLLLFARPGHLGRVPAVLIICGPELVAWAKFSQF
jgi:hypothetical protein